MEKVVKGIWACAEENNKLLALGYKYKVQGDFKLDNNSIDPWSGMPVVNGNTHYFTDKEEAEAYAKKQTCGYREVGKIIEVKREETPKEYKERFEAEKRARAEKKAKREKEKADAMGMTVEEYHEYKKMEAKKKRYVRDIEKLEKEVAELLEIIAYKKEFLENN